MTTTITLLAALQAALPNLTFETVDRDQTAFADDGEYASVLIGVQVEGMLIIDPFSSSCGRFDVEPLEAYGLPNAAARELQGHNRPPAPPTSTLAQ